MRLYEYLLSIVDLRKKKQLLVIGDSGLYLAFIFIFYFQNLKQNVIQILQILLIRLRCYTSVIPLLTPLPRASLQAFLRFPYLSFLIYTSLMLLD